MPEPRPVIPVEKKPPEVPVVSIIKREDFLNKIEDLTESIDEHVDQLERHELELRYYVIELKNIRRSLEAMVELEKSRGT